MHIFLVGQFEESWSSEKMYNRILTSMGHEINSFDYIRAYKLFGKDIHRVPKIGDFIINITNKKLFNEVKKVRPDVLFVFKGEGILPSTISKIKREIGTKTIFWMPDDPQLFNEVSRNVAFAYDYVLTSSEQCIPMYKYLGVKKVEYLPFMCDPAIHKKVKLNEEERAKYESDICFVGTSYPEREFYLSVLTNFNLKIWGHGWKNSSLDNAIRKKVIGEGIDPVTMVKIFNASKIVLNIHHAQMKYGGMKANSRVFEATGCGAFLLTDKTVGLEDLFECGKELVCYNDKDELVELVEYYLNHPEERKIIAEEGQKRSYREHTIDLRMKRVEEIAYNLLDE